MLITYKKLSLNQKSTYYYILCYFPIQFCVSLCIGCTGKRSGISVKGLRKFMSSEGLCCLCRPRRDITEIVQSSYSFRMEIGRASIVLSGTKSKHWLPPQGNGNFSIILVSS